MVVSVTPLTVDVAAPTSPLSRKSHWRTLSRFDALDKLIGEERDKRQRKPVVLDRRALWHETVDRIVTAGGMHSKEADREALIARLSATPLLISSPPKVHCVGDRAWPHSARPVRTVKPFGSVEKETRHCSPTPHLRRRYLGQGTTPCEVQTPWSKRASCASKWSDWSISHPQRSDATIVRGRAAQATDALDAFMLRSRSPPWRPRPWGRHPM